jgi:predicted metal-dependent phosphoesterase TrpH
VLAAAQRHPHLADLRPAGQIRVDLHSHTMWSGDSTSTPDDIERAVAESGIDVLCITDHNAVAGAFALRDQLACRVVIGEELRTSAGELIGLFLTERVPMGMSPVDSARAIRDQGGVVYVPHPFDPMRAKLSESALVQLAEDGLIDAIEVFNAKTSLHHLNVQAQQFATRWGLASGAGSDAHVPDALGAAYVEMGEFDGPVEFLERLGQGRVVGHHWDKPRPWSSRIIPSVSEAR